MFTFRAQGLGRRALRATLFATVALLTLLTIALAASLAGSPTNQFVLVGYGSSSPESVLGATSPPVASQTATDGSFAIAGSVSGMYPGLTVPMVLTVTNPKSFPIVVTSITTTVGNASAVCSASNLSVSAFAGHLTVPALGSAGAAVKVSMAPSAGDTCQGATFPLVYSGLASKP